jgi:hypothetical protein
MLERFLSALILTAACAFAGGPMIVEEPSSPPPVDPELEAGAWKSHNSELTAKEKAAREARRRQVEALAEKIREKRESLEAGSGDDKERSRKELQDLVLDKDKDKELNKAEKRNEAQRKRLEKLEEKLDKQLPKNPRNPPKGPKDKD